MKVPMKDWRFLGCTAEYAAASVALFGAPFDGTVTYRPGARFAPAAMRAESFGIETFSPYWDRDLEDCAVCDLGDIDIPIGNKVIHADLPEYIMTFLKYLVYHHTSLHVKQSKSAF